MRRIRNKDRFGKNIIPIQELLINDSKKKKKENDDEGFSTVFSMFLIFGPAILIFRLIFNNAITRAAWSIWWMSALGVVGLIWICYILELNSYKAKNIFGFAGRKYTVERLGKVIKVKLEDILVGDLITLDSNIYRVPADIMITEIIGDSVVYTQDYVLGNDGLDFEPKHVMEESEKEEIKLGTVGEKYSRGILYGLSYVNIDKGKSVKGKVIAVGEDLVAYNVLKHHYEIKRG